MKDKEPNKMSDIQQTINSDKIPLTDELVLTYLQDNPEFFNRNKALVTNLRLKDNRRGTVSLVERQQLQLREKVHGLEDEITQLMSVANHNEQLFSLYSDLYLRLIDCQSAGDLLDCLHQVTTELLSLSAFKLWLTPNSTSDQKIVHRCITENDCAGVMQNRLTHDDYYFGRLQATEQGLVFSQQCPGSVVLVKLIHANHTLGFLAISSTDAQHFDPRMDTLLLSQLKRIVAKLLFKQLT